MRKVLNRLKHFRFSIPVGLLYSRKYFSEETRQAVIDMVEDVRHAFIVMLGEVTWMDDEVREKAIEKAEKIVVHVGYSNELYENVELEEYYEDLEMEPDDYFNNSLRWDAFNSTQEFRTLRRSVNISGWEKIRYLNPTYVNAFYFNEDNTMRKFNNIEFIIVFYATNYLIIVFYVEFGHFFALDMKLKTKTEGRDGKFIASCESPIQLECGLLVSYRFKT